MLIAAAINVLKGRPAWTYVSSHHFLQFLIVLSLAALVVSAACCLLCIRPRVGDTKPMAEPSVIFFGHIASSFPDADDYAWKAGAVASDARLALREVSRQVWVNAGVARDKHLWVPAPSPPSPPASPWASSRGSHC